LFLLAFLFFFKSYANLQQKVCLYSRAGEELVHEDAEGPEVHRPVMALGAGGGCAVVIVLLVVLAVRVVFVVLTSGVYVACGACGACGEGGVYGACGACGACGIVVLCHLVENYFGSDILRGAAEGPGLASGLGVRTGGGS